MTRNKKGVSRRVLKGAAAVAGPAPGPAPSPASRRSGRRSKNITLRQFGTGVSNLNAIADKCKADLGITLEMTAMDSDAAAQRAVTQPDSYDIADIEYWICKKVFPTGVLQPMDVKKLKYYDKIVPLFNTGKLTPDSVIAQGTAPHTVGFVEAQDTKFAKAPTNWFTMVPTIYNADTLGIRPDLVGRDITNWADILDPAFKGKTSILNIPSIGIMDAAMIMEVSRQHQICRQGQHDQGGDRQDHRLPDQDQAGRPVPRLLEDLRRSGQPDGLGRSRHPVDVVAGGRRRALQGHRPAATSRSRKATAHGAAASALATHLSGAQLDAAYEYINWYTSGWVGGYLNRQGYYSASRHRQEVHDRRRVGLLDGGQAGPGRHQAPTAR